MKKILLLAVVALMIVACGKKAGFQSALPKDAIAVMSFNPKSIGGKINADDFKQSAIYKEIDEQFAEDDTKNRELVMSLLADPKESGLSMTDDIYFFMLKDNKGGVLARVADKKKIDAAVEKAGVQSTTEGDKTVAGRMDDDTAVAVYDNKVFMFYASEEDYSTALPHIQSLLSQKAEDGLMGIKPAADALLAKDDVCVVVKVGDLMSQMNSAMGMGMNMMPAGVASVENAVYVMTGNFEKGKMVGDMKLVFLDKESEKAYLDLTQKMNGKFKGSLLKYIPENAAIAFGANLHGAGLYEYMESMPDMQSTLRQVPPVKTVMEAIDGDFVMALTGYDASTKMPVFSALVELSKPDVILGYASMAASIGAKSVGENQYSFAYGNINVSFGLKDNMFYITNDPMTISALSGEKIASLSNLGGGYSMGLINFESGREVLSAVPMDSDTREVMMPLLEMFGTMEMSASTPTNMHIEVSMIDKSRNAAEVVFTTVDAIVKAHADEI